MLMMAWPIYYAALAAAIVIICKDFPIACATTIISGHKYTSFTRVLADISSSTIQLTINNTKIENLDFDALLLHAPQLRKLNVMSNSKLCTTIGRVNFPKLETVYFSANKLSVHPLFESCPKLLVYSIRKNAVALPQLNITDFEKCPKLWKVVLENTGLEHFPNFTQLNSTILSWIEISKNKLVSVDKGALFRLYGLKNLRLHKNHMPTIPSLRDLVSLEELSMWGNTMADKGAMDLNWLYLMPNLKTLLFGSSFTFTEPPDMSAVPLLTKFSIDFEASASVYLPADYLDSHPKITQLILYGVQMEELLPKGPSKWLLTTLRLERCTIGNLTADTFEEFGNLRVLRLRCTNVPYLPLLTASRSTLATLHFIQSAYLTSIPAGYFSNFTQLSQVFLYYNKLTEIPYLGGSTTITTVNMNGNKISKIAANAFEGFCCLTSLYLNRNKLNSITFTIPSTIQHLELHNNGLVTVRETDFPLAEGTLKKVILHGNKFECHQSMCFTLTGPLSPIFDLDLNPCLIPTDLIRKPKEEVALDLSCPDEACYHIPVIPNASSEVMSKYVWYTCNSDFLFADGVHKKRLLCQSAILSTDDIVSAGCQQGVGIKKREFTQNGAQSYSDDLPNMIGKTIRVDKIEVEAPNDLSCARVCSRLADCVGYKVVYPTGRAKGKCEVSIVQA